MKTQNLIILTTLFFLLVSSINGVQAQELTEINASEILEKIETGEDVYLENVRIIGELNLNKLNFNSKVYLPRSNSMPDQAVESEIIIKDSIFENNLDFSEK